MEQHIVAVTMARVLVPRFLGLQKQKIARGTAARADGLYAHTTGRHGQFPQPVKPGNAILKMAVANTRAMFLAVGKHPRHVEHNRALLKTPEPYYS